ncbi:hypothetical protein MPL3365_610002 [Mesorhizobium plurifarium]|uniref:Uncharacterized protein n=1 Tax=Mesorhizobium plurifarium TaxID=69974 RepID=A0A090GB99_MESPL|nr:hypothetical protein MPL3365_610002 [Mesorhizobium plurifarium]
MRDIKLSNLCHIPSPRVHSLKLEAPPLFTHIRLPITVNGLEDWELLKSNKNHHKKEPRSRECLPKKFKG